MNHNHEEPESDAESGGLMDISLHDNNASDAVFRSM
jgi:hypothetical protein